MISINWMGTKYNVLDLDIWHDLKYGVECETRRVFSFFNLHKSQPPI